MGLRRARGFAVKAAALFRLAHLIAAAGVVFEGPVDGRSVVLLACAGAVSVVLYVPALVRGWFSGPGVWADVLVTGCCLPWVAVAVVGEGQAVAPHGWLMVQSLSAAAAAVVAFGWRGTALALALLLATSLGMHGVVPDSDPEGVLDHVSAVATSVALTGGVWWYTRRQGILLDAAHDRAVAAEAARARQAERTAHHAALHDTVLATLTTIGAGRVDANAPAVRERCAREAAYVRRLVESGDVPSPGGAADARAALEEAVRRAEGLGLTVKAQYHAVPDLPREVAEALAAAVSEALNNVSRHAGTDTAYVTAVGGARGGVEVTVADRGTGFDASGAGGSRGAAGGTGLRRSVRGRLAAVGGAADVDSRPGEGTAVELRWPA
ncbi:ATP-binding protein [Streptomyces sp. NPDC090077]|uniref:ATP-binding protein n=1 Tax=Streptomyces sp. NPDC090077 TaxID=3365938 RepID=UPI003828C581